MCFMNASKMLLDCLPYSLANSQITQKKLSFKALCRGVLGKGACIHQHGNFHNDTRYETVQFLLLDFCTPLWSGTMDQCTNELRDSDNVSVAVTIVLLSAVEAYIRSISCHIGKTNTISGFRPPS